MWFQSSPISFLVLFGVFGHLSFAGPIGRAEHDVLYPVTGRGYHQARDIIINQGGIKLGKGIPTINKIVPDVATPGSMAKTGVFGAFSIIKSVNSCREAKKLRQLEEGKKTAMEAEEERLRNRPWYEKYFLDPIKAVGDAFTTQLPKAWSQENIDAFLKSGRDLVQAFGELPESMKNALIDLTNVKNLQAFMKSLSDLKTGISDIPDSVENGFKDLADPQNFAAFEKSFEDLGKGIQGIPEAMKNGASDFVQGIEFFITVAPGQLSTAFAQLTKSVTILMAEYEKAFPPGSNQRKIFDSVLAGLPMKPDTFKALPLRFNIKTSGGDLLKEALPRFEVTAKEMAEAINQVCNDKESIGLVES